MSARGPFSARLVAGLIAVGLAAFAALLLSLAFGGNLGAGRDGRAHALSAGATGFKGLVALTGRFRETVMIDGPSDLATEDLVVVALEPENRPEVVSELLKTRHGRATLLILPKWTTIAEPARRGWVRALGPGAGEDAAALLGRKIEVDVSSVRRTGGFASSVDFLHGLAVPVPREAQAISGPGVIPLIPAPDGGALLARLGDQPHYVAADPDMFNNHGLRDPAAARAALALLDGLNSTDAETVGFDLTVNGLAARSSPNLLRSALEPPFLPMILALLAAALLAGLHGAFRFGQARLEPRAIALGKAALVENSAGLIKAARREARLGGAYADVIRQEAARTTGASHWLSEEEVDNYLDRLGKPDEPGFSERAARLHLARDRHSLVAAARDLFQWKKDIIR